MKCQIRVKETSDRRNQEKEPQHQRPNLKMTLAMTTNMKRYIKHILRYGENKVIPLRLWFLKKAV